MNIYVICAGLPRLVRMEMSGGLLSSASFCPQGPFIALPSCQAHLRVQRHNGKWWGATQRRGEHEVTFTFTESRTVSFKDLDGAAAGKQSHLQNRAVAFR